MEKYNPQAFATTPAGASPRHLRHAFSCGKLRDDESFPTRYWAFDTVEERDAFLRVVLHARACDNPVTTKKD